MLFNTSKKFLPQPVKIFLGTKNDLRKILKSKLASLSDIEYEELSLNVSVNLKKLLDDLDVIQQHLVTGVFAPIEKEPKWFLEMRSEFNKLTAYPAIASQKMIYRLSPQSELIVSQDFGVEIFGPSKKHLEVKPKVVIVPGLGFSSDGKRLGRGKGFYDRYLESHPVIKIGVTFEMQLSEDIPMDEHDIKMDFVVTDQKIYRTKR